MINDLYSVVLNELCLRVQPFFQFIKCLKLPHIVSKFITTLFANLDNDRTTRREACSINIK